MRQVDMDYVVIAALFMSGLYVAITGLVMELWGFHQFFLHNYAGYITALLAGLHLALNWERVSAYLRWKLRFRPGRKRPTQLFRQPRSGRRGFLLAALAASGGFVLGWLLPGLRLRPATVPEGIAANYPPGDIGQFYHQSSKPGYWPVLRAMLDWGGQPARYKTYADAKQVALPAPDGYRGLSLEEAIEQRRSRREYTAAPLSIDELSRLLHASGGITDPSRGLRAAPSAGALYPIETYAVVHNVTGLEPGLYHYAVADHALELLRAESLRSDILAAGIGQEMLAQAAVCFVLTAIFQRTRWRYRERAYRYVLLEAGHLGQNLYLAASSIGLGACAVGAFLDDKLNDLLGLDGEQEAVLYIIAVGKV